MAERAVRLSSRQSITDMIRTTLINNARSFIHKQKKLLQFCSIFLLSGALFLSCTKNREVDLSQSFSAGSLVQSEEDTSSDVASTEEEEKEQLSPDLQNNIIETSISFLGWKGESAIIRQEVLLEDSQIRTLFFAMKSDGSGQQLYYSDWQNESEDELPIDPPDLERGKLLVSDYWAIEEFPKVVFEIDADRKEVYVLEEAIINWTPGQEIPKTKATLRIQFQPSSGSTMSTVWEESIELKPFFGEAGLEYDPPRLRVAVLSPRESFLFIEITYGGEIDYRVISIPQKTHK